MGDQCWFVARAVDVKAPHSVRLLWAEPIAAERVRTRVPELFRSLGLTALCVDAGTLGQWSVDSTHLYFYTGAAWGRLTLTTSF